MSSVVSTDCSSCSKKRVVSTAARKRMAESQKKRWAAKQVRDESINERDWRNRL